MNRTFAPSSEFFQHTETGGGGGGGQAPAGGGQAPASGGQAPAQGGGGGPGGGGATPVTLTPDSMVIPPGSTTAVKYSDYIGSYVPRTELATHQAQAVQNFLKTIAVAKGKAKPQQQQQQQRTQPVDLFADVRGLPLIDGQSLAALGERMQKEGIAPLYEWAGQVNNYLEGIAKKLQLTDKMTGSLTEERSQQEFTGKMSKAVQALAKDMLPGVNLAEHPVIDEFAQDVYLSYNPADPNLEREFPGILKSRLEGILKLAGALNQAKLVAARETRRNFLRPGGGAQVAAQAGNRLSHRDLAKNLFAADASRT